MYEIVLRMRCGEQVLETLDSLESAQLAVRRYIARGYKAYYRTKVKRAAYGCMCMMWTITIMLITTLAMFHLFNSLIVPR